MLSGLECDGEVNTADAIGEARRGEADDRSRHFLTLLGAFLAANLSTAVASLFVEGDWEAALADLISGLIVLHTWRSTGSQGVSHARLAGCAVIARAVVVHRRGLEIAIHHAVVKCDLVYRERGAFEGSRND